MKASKTFKAGDKIFGKVKGFPAWPAVVEGLIGKRYNVTFYGTKEKGVLKPEDMFYYLSHKEQLNKPKKKEFLRAIEEIEDEIQKAGTDGSDQKGETKTDNADATSTLKRGQKRKLSSASAERKSDKEESSEESQENGDEVKGKRDKPSADCAQEHIVAESEINESLTEEPTSKVKKDAPSKKTGGKKSAAQKGDKTKGTKQDESGEKTTLQIHEKEKSVDEKKLSSWEATLAEGLTDEEKIAFENIILIPETYLTLIKSYAAKLKERPEVFKEKNPDPGSLGVEFEGKPLILSAKLPSAKSIGIKYLPKPLDSFESELARAEDDAQTAQELIDLKTKLESGEQEFKEDPDKFIADFQCSEETLQQRSTLSVVHYKMRKLEWLTKESYLYELTTNIKKSLGLDKADPKSAISHLNEALEVEVEKLMLIKNQQFVEMIKRLLRYVGNVKSWEMSPEETRQFEKDAEIIRKTASKVYDRIKSVFSYGEDIVFWDKYCEEVKTFKEQTGDMKTAEVFGLCSEPCSRKAILDQLLDHHNQEASKTTTTATETTEK